MEKLLRPYDKESMKMAILKHEETFKQQVYELHRLYRIQKTLMKSMETSRPINGSYMNHQSSGTRHELEHPVDDEFIDESEIELTLGPTKYMPRKKHGTPTLTSDSGPNSFSSSSTESCHMLFNNGSRPSSSMATAKRKTNRARDEFIGRELGLLQVSDTTLGYQNGSKNKVDLEQQLRQERMNQPPWLFQVLSMNVS